jgi:recombination protein RecA
VKKSGAWFTYEGEQLGQGRENVKVFLAENLDLMVEIMEKVKEAAGIVEADGTEVDGTEVDLDLVGENGMTEADDEPISLD